MDLQILFLNELRKAAGQHTSFVNDASAVLGLSLDSMYRRFRGETVLSLEEVQKLCNHYHFSIDTVLSPTTERVLFRRKSIGPEGYTLFDWMKSLRRNLTLLHQANDKHMLYAGKDIPLLYYFGSPEMLSFKMYFWMKSMYDYPDYQTVKYQGPAMMDPYMELGSEIWDYYKLIDSTEIWTEDCVNVTLNQIEFYYTCGFLEDADQALRLCDVFRALLNQARQWSIGGVKTDGKGILRLYKNEILFADNTVLFKVNDQRIVFIPHNMIEVISTKQQAYCEQTERDMLSYVDRSVAISGTGEKERNKFFNTLDAKIVQTKERIAGLTWQTE